MCLAIFAPLLLCVFALIFFFRLFRGQKLFDFITSSFFPIKRKIRGATIFPRRRAVVNVDSLHVRRRFAFFQIRLPLRNPRFFPPFRKAFAAARRFAPALSVSLISARRKICRTKLAFINCCRPRMFRLAGRGQGIYKTRRRSPSAHFSAAKIPL